MGKPAINSLRYIERCVGRADVPKMIGYAKPEVVQPHRVYG